MRRRRAAWRLAWSWSACSSRGWSRSPGSGCAGSTPAPSSPSPAGVLDERRQPLAERAGVLLVQVDLVGRAADYEPHRLVGRAALQIVFERYGYFRRHPGLLDRV